jgi:hypothetical protein
MAVKRTDVDVVRVDIVAEGSNEDLDSGDGAYLTLLKSKPRKEESMPTIEELQAQVEAEKARADAAEQALTTAKADLAKAKPAGEADDDLWKGVSPLLKARFEQMEKDQREAQERADRALREQGIQHALAKSKEDFKGVVTEPEKFAPVWHRLGEVLTDKELAVVEDVMKSAGQRIAQAGTFGEIGTTEGTSTQGGGNFRERLMKAKQKVQAETPNIDPESLTFEALARDAELKREYDAMFGVTTNGRTR